MGGLKVWGVLFWGGRLFDNFGHLGRRGFAFFLKEKTKRKWSGPTTGRLKNQPVQAHCRQCLPAGRQQKTPETLRKRGCTTQTTSDTTSSSKQETSRTAVHEGLHVHVKLPVVRRMRGPQGSTFPLFRCQRPKSTSIASHNSGIHLLVGGLRPAAPSTVAAFGRALPHEVTALRTVMSTANWAPWFISNPEANTSVARSSVAGTLMFMSRNLAFSLTVAPASRHTRASVRSVGSARERRRPERGHAALCCPRQSRAPPQTHLA